MSVTVGYPEVGEELLQAVVRRVREVGRPERVVLFGSRARGDHRSGSDLDLLIVEEPAPAGRDGFGAYWGALQELFPEMDVLVRTPREVAEWADVPNYLVTAALREGRTLYDTGRRWEGDGLVKRDVADHARGWLLKAQSDLATARRTLDSDGPYDTACYHAQQAAEKALKALLAFEGQAIPRTHKLEEPITLCLTLRPGLDVAGADFPEPTKRGIDSRYDVYFWPEQEDAAEALAQAERVYAAIVAVLPEATRA